MAFQMAWFILLEVLALKTNLIDSSDWRESNQAVCLKQALKAYIYFEFWDKYILETMYTSASNDRETFAFIMANRDKGAPLLFYIKNPFKDISQKILLKTQSWRQLWKIFF